MTLLSKRDLSIAVFGSWDGCIGVLAALLAAHDGSVDLLLAVGLGAAVGNTFSMATGQWESMGANEPNRLRGGIVMGVAAFVGGLIPTLPFLLHHKTTAYVLAIAGAWGLATLVWVLKGEGLVGAIRTYTLLVLTVVATLAVSLLG